MIGVLYLFRRHLALLFALSAFGFVIYCIEARTARSYQQKTGHQPYWAAR